MVEDRRVTAEKPLALCVEQCPGGIVRPKHEPVVGKRTQIHDGVCGCGPELDWAAAGLGPGYHWIYAGSTEASGRIEPATVERPGNGEKVDAIYPPGIGGIAKAQILAGKNVDGRAVQKTHCDQRSVWREASEKRLAAPRRSFLGDQLKLGRGVVEPEIPIHRRRQQPAPIVELDGVAIVFEFAVPP